MFGNVYKSKARWCVKRESQDVYTATRKQDYCLDSQIKQQELHLPLSLQCTTLADQLTRVLSSDVKCSRVFAHAMLVQLSALSQSDINVIGNQFCMYTPKSESNYTTHVHMCHNPPPPHPPRV